MSLPVINQSLHTSHPLFLSLLSPNQILITHRSFTRLHPHRLMHFRILVGVVAGVAQYPIIPILSSVVLFTEKQNDPFFSFWSLQVSCENPLLLLPYHILGSLATTHNTPLIPFNLCTTTCLSICDSDSIGMIVL